MAFEFQCQCGKLLSAEPEWIGKNARCPSCSTVLVVPDPDGFDSSESSSAWPKGPAEPGVDSAQSFSATKQPLDFKSSANRKTRTDELQSENIPFWKSALPSFNRKTANILVAGSIIILLLAVVFIIRHFSRSPNNGYAGSSISAETSASNTAIATSEQPAATSARQPQPTTQAPAAVGPSTVATGRNNTDEPAAGAGEPARQVQGIDARLASPAGTVWFEGVRRRGIQLASGEQIALFLDPDVKGLSGAAAGQERPQILSLLALNDADLLVWLYECQAFSHGVTINGQSAESMLHVVVFPLERKSLANEDESFITFQPGPIKQLNTLIQQFGPAEETQLWLGQDSQDLGLTSRVYFWNNVGVAASEQGTISHVLLRGPIVP